MAQSTDEECGICLDALTNPVALPCSHKFCSDCLDSWRSKYGSGGDKEKIGRACPLCRKKIPPSREMLIQLESYRKIKEVMEANGDILSRQYTMLVQELERLEQEVGEWSGEVLDDAGDESLALPLSIIQAAVNGDVQKVLDWLGPPPVDKNRINAKCAEVMGFSLIFATVIYSQYSGLLSIMLQFGADANAPDASGGSALMMATKPERSQQACLLLEWGAETNLDGAITKDELVERALDLGNVKLANLLESEFGGRRCELVNYSTRPELNGKTCVVEKYLPDKGRYKIEFEGSGQKALVPPNNLKRRDRTPTDCGYYITFENGCFSRRDFASKEECQAYVAELEAKHATEQLADLNIDSSGSSKGRRGKKGKKKGRK